MKKIKRKAAARTPRPRSAKKRAAARPAALAVPRGPHATPYLVIKDAARAIEFYKKAFGATEVVRLEGADGRIAHCEIKIGDASILLADEWEGVGAKSPSSLGGCPVIIHLEVDDIDSIAQRAIDAGAKVIFPIQDQFYGERAGRLQDPFGHMWLLSMKIASLADQEMRKREQDYFKQNVDK